MYAVCLMDANHYPTYEQNPNAYSGARVISYSATQNAINGTFEYTIPDDTDANSFVFHLRMASNSGDTSTVTGDVIVTIT